MEERRVGSKNAFVVAWLLTLGFVLAVGPFGSRAETVECDGADCVDAQTRSQPHTEAREKRHRSAKDDIPKDRLHVQEWRGRDPEICFAKGCDERPPTFCYAAAKLPIVKNGLKIPRHRALEPRFRTTRTRR